jgi:iron complex transport system ATP-binding protein
MSVASPAVRASALNGGYGSTRVLHDVSFEAAPGEMLAIVGPNGAGKSTLLKIVGGTMRPWSGTINLLGGALAGYQRRELARTVAMVSQENPLAFRFTVLEIVLMGRAPHVGAFHFESPGDLEIARHALERFGLLTLADRHVQELSGGERKRVFLARALAQEPKIALLDEPTAFLDLKHAAEILMLFRDLCTAEAMTVIATLHDLNAAALWADRVMLMKHGAAIACGPPDEVLTPENLRQAYETEVYVGRNPSTGALIVLPAVPPR